MRESERIKEKIRRASSVINTHHPKRRQIKPNNQKINKASKQKEQTKYMTRNITTSFPSDSEQKIHQTTFLSAHPPPFPTNHKQTTHHVSPSSRRTQRIYWAALQKYLPVLLTDLASGTSAVPLLKFHSPCFAVTPFFRGSSSGREKPTD